MSGTAKKTLDTDQLIVRQIFAYNPNDSLISTGFVLTATSNGGTAWSYPSTIQANPAFNEVVANGTRIVADASYNILTLSTLDGLGMIRDSLNKRITLYNKAFTQFDISGGNTIRGYSNNLVTPTVKFVGKGGVTIASDPLTNTMTFTGVPTSVESGIYAFNQVNVISNSTTLDPSAPGGILTALSPTSRLNIIGLNDIILSTNITSNAFTIGISSFTSADYLANSTLTNTLLSTVSTFFFTSSQTLDLISNVSVGIQQKIQYDNNYATAFYLTKNIYAANSTATANLITNKINFQSSIGVPETGQTQLGTYGGGVFEFSTATFNLSTLSSLLYVANIEITEQLGLLFNFNPTVSKNNIMTVSSFLVAGDSIIPETLFTSPWMAPNDTGSNLLTGTVKMSMNYLTAYATLTSSYSIVHRISPFNLSGYSVQNRMSEQNGVSIQIWKS
jgi:hypothetical protein